MPDLTSRDRVKMAAVRNHLAAAVNDLPWLPETAPMFRDIQSLMRGCTDLIAGRTVEEAEPVRDHDAEIDSSAGWDGGGVIAFDYSREDCGTVPTRHHTGEC